MTILKQFKKEHPKYPGLMIDCVEAEEARRGKHGDEVGLSIKFYGQDQEVHSPPLLRKQAAQSSVTSFVARTTPPEPMEREGPWDKLEHQHLKRLGEFPSTPMREPGED